MNSITDISNFKEGTRLEFIEYITQILDLALELICKKLKKLKASDELIKVCKRKEEISIIPPP